MVRLHNGLFDGLEVKWTKGTQVDNLNGMGIKSCLQLLTSALIPLFSSSSAASKATFVAIEWEVSVTCSPARSILAFPMGRTKSLPITSSETGKLTP